MRQNACFLCFCIKHKQTLYLAQGKVTTYVWNYGSPDVEECSKQEAEDISQEIDAEIQRYKDTLSYHHNVSFY